MKTKLSILLTFVIVICFALPGISSNITNLLANQRSQISKGFIADTSDCDWPMFGRTPDGNRVAPDGCGPRTNNLILKSIFKQEIGEFSNLVIENDRWYFGYDASLMCTTDYPFKKIWEYEAGGRISAPLVSNGFVFFGSSDNKMYCLSAEKGEKIWEFETNNYIDCKPAISDGKIYFGSSDSKMYCLDVETGKLIWDFKTGGAVVSTPAIFRNKVYFGSFDKIFYCLSADKGKKAWEFTTDWEINTSPVISDGNVFFHSNENLYCLSANEGRKNWSTRTGSISSPIALNDRIFVSSYYGYAYCFYASGEKAWEYMAGEKISKSPIILNNKVFIGSDTKFSCLSVSNGRLIWEIKRPGEWSPDAVSDEKVYASISNHFICFSTENGKKLWDYNLRGNYFSSLSISDDKIFVGSNDRKLYCLSSKTGEQFWEFETGDAISSTPSFMNNKIYFGSWDKKFYCLDCNTGKKLWEFVTDGMISSSPLVYDDRVYFGSRDSKVYCLSVVDGTKKWIFKTGDAILGFGTPTILDGKIYIGSSDKKMYCLSAETGTEKWEFETKADIWSSPVISNKKVFFNSNNGIIYCLNPESGKLVWSYDIGAGFYSSPAVANDKLFIGSLNNSFYCISSDTGKKLWDYQTNGEIYNSAIIYRNNVFFGSFDKKLYCLSTETGKKNWERQMSNVIELSPALTKGKIFLPLGGRILCFGDKPPSKLEFSSTNITIDPCQTQKLEAKVFDQDGNPIDNPELTWSIDNESVGKIGKDGVFVPSKPGKAVVTCSIENLSAKVDIEVKEFVTFEPGSLTFDSVTAKKDFKKTMLVSNNSDKQIDIAFSYAFEGLMMESNNISLKANEKKEMTITYNSKVFLKSQTFTTDIKASYLGCQKKITCNINFSNKNECIIVLPMTLDFGTVHRGETKTMELIVASPGFKSQMVVTCNQPWLDISKTRLEPSDEPHKISVFVNASALPPEEYPSCEITITSDDKECSQVIVPVTIKTEPGITIKLQIDSNIAYINDNKKILDAPAKIIGGRTMVPLRFITEAFGCKVEWDNKTKMIKVIRHDMLMKLWIGKEYVEVNGVLSIIDAPPTIYKGKTMVPLKFIAESFGATTKWEAKDRRITIIWPK